MIRPGKPDPVSGTLRQALVYVAWRPRLYLAFGRVVVLYVIAKGRFYWLCWSSGYSVRYVRRVAREDHILS